MKYALGLAAAVLKRLIAVASVVTLAVACSAPTAPSASRALPAPAVVVHDGYPPGTTCVTELNGRTSLGDCDLESGERGFLVSAG